MTDNITILTHTNPLAKVWVDQDGSTEPSANAKYFKLQEKEVQNISELSELLKDLEDKSNSCIIRGKYIGDEEAKKIGSEYREGFVRRTKEVFDDQKLHFILVDIDDFEPELYDPLEETTKAIDEFIEDYLPIEFNNTSYHWQLSGSAGKESNKNILKAHVWFWLDKPFSSFELKEWAKNNIINADHSLFNVVQIHFTASPIFKKGVKNPIKNRSGLVEKENHKVNIEIDCLDIADYGYKKHLKKDVLDAAIKNDSAAQFLFDNDYVKSLDRSGRLNIECPFKDGHSIESNETSTIYYPANTNGYPDGHFHCHHNSCRERKNPDYLEKLDINKVNILNKDDSNETGRKIISDLYSHNGKVSLIRNREEFYQFNDKAYYLRENEGIRADIRRYLDKSQRKVKDGKDGYKTVKFNPKISDINGAIDAVKAETLLEGVQPPLWRSDVEKNPSEYTNMNNGIVHLLTRKIVDHTPDYFSVNILPYDYTTENNPEVFKNFLFEIFDGDEESIDLVQEMMGYFLSHDTSFQKMFMFLGPPRSGKSTLCYVVESLIGALNVANPKLNDFGQQFGMSMLEDKTLAIVPDARIEQGARVRSIIETLLCITGEDTVSFDKKHKDYYTGKLNTRILLVSNVSPQLIDTSNALVSRLIFLKTQNSFLGKEDTDLRSKLIKELPEIFSWALDGRDRLLKRGKFIQPKSAAHLVEEFRKLSNPIESFVAENCTLGSNRYIIKDDLFMKYNSWADTHAAKNYDHKEHFSSDLLSCISGVQTVRKSIEGYRRYCYAGIDYNTDLGFNFDK